MTAMQICRVFLRKRPEQVLMDATIHAQAQCSMMQADSRTSKLSAAKRLELERGMTRVPFQKFEVFIRKSAHLQGQRCMAAPKPCRGGMDHNLR